MEALGAWTTIASRAFSADAVFIHAATTEIPAELVYTFLFDLADF